MSSSSPTREPRKPISAASAAAVIDRYVRDRPFRAVEYQVPPDVEESDDYEGAVSEWHADISETFGRLIAENSKQIDIGTFLVWGDPTLYDGTLGILEHLRAKGAVSNSIMTSSGISIQALAAGTASRPARLAEAVLITNGRNWLRVSPTTSTAS